MTFGTAKLIVAVRDKKIIGGCFILFSDNMIELFMMSTPKKYLKCGTNYSIINFIYSHAFKKNITNINWQASNPPDGGGAHYKKKWNAQPRRFYIFNKDNESGININYIQNHFKDLYVFPYSILK